jgi:hypothetical protein
MTLFTRLKQLSSYLYEKSVEIFTKIIGKSKAEKETILDTYEPPPSPITNQSDGSIDTSTNIYYLTKDEQLKQILDSLNNLDFYDPDGVIIYYILELQYADGTSNNILFHRGDGLDKIKTFIKEEIDGVLTAFTDSATVVYELKNKELIDYTMIRKKELKIMGRKNRNDAGLFPYRHNIKNEYIQNLLKELEILHIDDKSLPDSCFLSSIKNKISKTKFESICRSLNTNVISSKELSNIGKTNKITFKLINVTEKDGKYNSRPTNYPIGSDYEIIELVLFNKHFFSYDPLDPIYENDWGNYITKKTSHLSTLSIVKHLLENKEKYLVKLTTEQEFFQSHKTGAFVPKIEIDDHTKLVEYKNEKTSNDPIGFFDVETTTDSDRHNVYHLSYRVIDPKVKKPQTYVCNNLPSNEIVQQFLKELTREYGSIGKDFMSMAKITLYAHNSTYDASFVIPYLNNLKILEKDGKYVSVTGIYNLYENRSLKSLNILIKDTYRIIPKPLRDFGQMFGLDQEKEIMYYNMYTEANRNRFRVMPKIELDRFIKEFNEKSLLKPSVLEKMENKFYENMIEWKCINTDGTYNILKYSAVYCDIDVEIMIDGFNEFRKTFKEIDQNVDPINSYSLPTIANKLLTSKGCYDQTFEFDGFLGDYFNGFIIGGRTMSSENKKFIIDKFNTIAVDWNSLYPSAMAQFDGFLKGKPIELNDDQLNLKFLKNTNHYFIEIKITKINRHRKLPLLSKIDRDGVRNWTNDMVGEIVKVDRYYLDDLIEFQQIEFEILNGYYFKDGFNRKICRLMTKLYESRITDRNNGNDALAEIKKLVMNSSYGKTIQKPNKIDSKIIDINRFNYKSKTYEKDQSVITDFINKNHHLIVNYKKMSEINDCGKYEFKMKRAIIENSTKPHQGIMILSYSKRLMNRAICLLDDLMMECYYQDTDSIHMKQMDYYSFKKEFKAKYKFDIEGSGLGQAKVDLDVYCKCNKCLTCKCAKCQNDYSRKKICTDNKSKRQCKDRVITTSIIVGKKSYFDKMEGKCPKTGLLVKVEKCKLKGIPADAITDYIDRTKNKTPEQLYDIAMVDGIDKSYIPRYQQMHKNISNELLYRIFYDGNYPVKFELSSNNKIRFEKTTNQFYRTATPLVRRVIFRTKNIDRHILENNWCNDEPPLSERFIDDY